MASGYQIALATPGDIPGILALQEVNLPGNGGSLSVRQTAEWFTRAMNEMPLILARRDGTVVGYMVATPLKANSQNLIIQAMLGVYSPPANCYLYGPVCVAASARGQGLAGLMFKELCARLPGLAAMTFVRADNRSSRAVHQKMGMRELGVFTHDDVAYIALSYPA